MKKIVIIIVSLILSLTERQGNAAPRAALPGDGTSEISCSVTTERDVDSAGRPVNGSLRQRLELYNRDTNPLCRFDIYFTFQNRTISISQPLVIAGSLHQGLARMRGTTVEGYGDAGDSEHPESLRLTIDATRISNPNACAITIQGGFEARTQINGLTLLVRHDTKAICDENGQDLFNSDSPNCIENGIAKKGRDCEFEDVTLFTREEESPVNFYYFNPGIIFYPVYGSGGNSTGGASGSGGSLGGASGSGSLTGSAGGGGGTGGVGGSSFSRGDQPPVFVGCALIREDQR